MFRVENDHLLTVNDGNGSMCGPLTELISLSLLCVLYLGGMCVREHTEHD